MARHSFYTKAAWRRRIRGPLDPLQGDYLCSFASIRGWQKNPNFPCYIAPDFLQYLSEDANQKRPKQERKISNMKNRNPLTSKKHIKTRRWFSPNRFFSILRMASGAALLSAATVLGL